MEKLKNVEGLSMRIRIGSFNIKKFGKKTMTTDRLKNICEIIDKEHMDIVSFQEVFSGERALNNLRFLLNGWEYCFADPTRTSNYTSDKDERGEGYAFAWNAKKLKPVEYNTEHGTRVFYPRIVNGKDDNDGLNVKCNDIRDMARIPMYGRFVPIHQSGFEIRLINIHIAFGGSQELTATNRRRREYDILVDHIYPTVRSKRFGNFKPSYTIALGDYNLNLKKPDGVEEDVYRNPLIKGRTRVVDDQIIMTVQDKLTSISTAENGDDNGRYSQNYDHFTYCVNEIEMQGNRCVYNRVDAVEKYHEKDFDAYFTEVSDHVPIILDLYIGEEEPRYDNNGYRKTS